MWFSICVLVCWVFMMRVWCRICCCCLWVFWYRLVMLYWFGVVWGLVIICWWWLMMLFKVLCWLCGGVICWIVFIFIFCCNSCWICLCCDIIIIGWFVMMWVSGWLSVMMFVCCVFIVNRVWCLVRFGWCLVYFDGFMIIILVLLCMVV